MFTDREFEDYPLDDTGVELSEIPEDFDKADDTILRCEQIEVCWKWYDSSPVPL
jgi:hypothetical protein